MGKIESTAKEKNSISGRKIMNKKWAFLSFVLVALAMFGLFKIRR